VGWESSFAIVLFAPWQVGAAYMAVGAGFHVANAAVMGLNNFAIAFLGAYPALMYFILAR